MKKVLLVSLALVLIAGQAMAVDHIGIYSDMAGTSCSGTAAVGVATTVYAVHTITDGATASQFKVVDNTGLFALGANPLGGFLAIGNAYTGISLAYLNCLPNGNVAVLSLGYLAFAPPAPCLTLEVVPDPTVAIGTVLIADCNFFEISATGGKFVFGETEDCPCVAPNATEQSTWGKVKSLYR